MASEEDSPRTLYTLNAEDGNIYLTTSYPTPPADRTLPESDVAPGLSVLSNHHVRDGDLMSPDVLGNMVPMDEKALALNGTPTLPKRIRSRYHHYDETLKKLDDESASVSSPRYDRRAVGASPADSQVPTDWSMHWPGHDYGCDSSTAATEVLSRLPPSASTDIIDPAWQTHICHGKPPLWTGSAMLSNKDSEIQHGVVQSPTFMIGLPLGGMIEYATSYTQPGVTASAKMC